MKRALLLIMAIICLSGCPEEVNQVGQESSNNRSGADSNTVDADFSAAAGDTELIQPPQVVDSPEAVFLPEVLLPAGEILFDDESASPAPAEPVVVGPDFVIKVPNAGAVIFDHTPPLVQEVSAVIDGQSWVVAYGDARDLSSGSLINGSGLATVQLWVKPEGWIWEKTEQQVSTASGTFYFVPPVSGIDYRFAVQSQDKAGNNSALMTPEMEKPCGRFLYPDDSGQVRLIIELPEGQSIEEFLVPWFDFLLYETIYEVGVGGPHGWGEDSADIYPFEGLPITNLLTGFDSADNFRGTPFIITNLARVAYINLGLPDNPDWIFSFGANRQLIKDDGNGNSIIEFSLADYIAPMSHLAFDYRPAETGSQAYIVVDAEDWDMRGLFWGISDQSEISQLTVFHYYSHAPWVVEEEPVDFSGWPAYLDLKRCDPMARLTIAAIDKDGNYRYINTDVWQAFWGEAGIYANDGAWEFIVP